MKNALVVTSESNVELGYTRTQFKRALSERGYNVHHIDLSDGSATDRAIIKKANPELAILCSSFALRNDEQFVQNRSLLKKLNCTFVNDLQAHFEISNKSITINKILKSGLPFLKTVVTFFNYLPRNSLGRVNYSNVDLDVLDEDIERLGGFPLVYKRICGSMGLQVHLVNSKEHLKEILVKHEIFPSFILQEYAKSAEFAMLCIRVIGDEVYPRFMLGSNLEEVNFKSVISQGRMQLPCALTDEIRNVALGATSLLGIDTARIDAFITDDGIKLCEVNSPGTILPTDQSYNINVADRVVDLAIRKLGQQ